MSKGSKAIASVPATIFGCIGAGWLVYSGVNEFVSWVSGFGSGLGFIKNFFTVRLWCFAILMLAVTFFVSLINDLSAIKNAVALFSTVITAILLVCYGIILVNEFDGKLPNFARYPIWEEIAMVVLLVGYILFFVYKINGGKWRSSAWTFCMVGVLGLLAVNIWQIAISAISTDVFIYDVFRCVAHIGVFYSGLKKY